MVGYKIKRGTVTIFVYGQPPKPVVKKRREVPSFPSPRRW